MTDGATREEQKAKAGSDPTEEPKIEEPVEAGSWTKERPEDGSRRKSEVSRKRNRRTKPEGNRKVDRRNR